MSPNASNSRWTPAQKLFFIELLCELHKNDELKPEERNSSKNCSESFIHPLKEKFPLCRWDRGRIERHYRQVINDYRWYCKAHRMRKSRAMRVFREGVATEEIHFGGPETMSFVQSHGQAALQSLRNGLAVDGNLTLELYHQLFSRCLSISVKETSTPEPLTVQAIPIASDLCGLAKMPRELFSMIMSYLSFPEIKACATVSKAFRDTLSPQLLTYVKFLGTLEGLVKELPWFIEALEQRPKTFSQTRHITFQFVGMYNSQAPEDTHTLPKQMANLIGCCLKKAIGLRNVAFDIDLRAELPQFNKQFRPDDKWKEPRSVTFHRASGKEFKTILCNFEPTTLEAVQLPMEARKAHYDILKSRFKSLKGLFIDTSYNYNVYKQSPLRYLDHKCLEPIFRDFAQLESLVLSESGCYQSGIRLEISPWGSLNKKIEALVEALKVRVHLRRFAFGLWSSRVLAHTIHQSWMPGLESNEQFIMNFDNLEPKPTGLEVDSWYTNLLFSILARVPQLLEVDILDRQRVYRGTRSENGINIKASYLGGLRERERFPHSIDTRIV